MPSRSDKPAIVARDLRKRYGDLEAVRLGKKGELGVAEFVERVGDFLVPDVTDPLEEEKRKDVRLEVGGIDGAAEDVGGLPEVRLERV